MKDLSAEIAGELYELTRELAERSHETSHGLLGGDWGYGAYWDDGRFEMHPYCWCDGDDCPWCCGCRCPDQAFGYTLDGEQVDLDTWAGFFDQQMQGLEPGSERWERRLTEIEQRRGQTHEPECEWCLSGGPAAAHGGGPGRSAPNFRDRESQAAVYWYKHIGRSMEIHPSPEAALAAVRSARASLRAG